MKYALRHYFMASIPAALVGIWNLGDQLQEQSAEAAGVWQLGLLETLRTSYGAPGSLLVSLALGATFLLPLLIAVAVTSRALAEIFSRTRGRGIDEGWFLSAWLYVLLLPATLPLHYAVLGFTFGAVFGCYVFGGTGRYIVSPALLGLAFVSISYPDFFAQSQWLPGSETSTSWSLLATEGMEAAESGGASWMALFLGTEIGALGTSSALAALLGAAYLIARGIVPAGIVAGAMIGLGITGELVGGIPALWHLAIGNFAFALAFIATDRSITPNTTAGCWIFGALFGALLVILRVADPARPEATVAALLLASLCIPLIDHIADSFKLSARTPRNIGHE